MTAMLTQHSCSEPVLEELNEAIAVRTVDCAFGEGYFVSTAAVGVLSTEGKQDHIFGFGCSTCPELARASAHFECIERFFSTGHGLSADILESDAVLITKSGTVLKSTNKVKDYLIGAQLNGQSLNANGVAVGPTFEDAYAHASLELLERHLSANWWSGSVGLGSPVSISDIQGCKCFAFCGSTNIISYAVVVALDSRKRRIITGTACRSDTESALQHAWSELHMLQHSAAAMDANPDLVANTPPSARRLYRGFSADHIAEAAGLLETRACISEDEVDLQSFLAEQIWEDTVQTIVLHSEQGLKCVRCVASDFLDGSRSKWRDGHDQPFY